MTTRYLDKMSDIISSWLSFSAVPNINKGISGIKSLKKYFMNFSVIIDILAFSLLNFIKLDAIPPKTPASKARSLEIMGGNENEKRGITLE
jgi:hypothetical protein